MDHCQIFETHNLNFLTSKAYSVTNVCAMDYYVLRETYLILLQYLALVVTEY